MKNPVSKQYVSALHLWTPPISQVCIHWRRMKCMWWGWRTEREGGTNDPKDFSFTLTAHHLMVRIDAVRVPWDPSTEAAGSPLRSASTPSHTSPLLPPVLTLPTHVSCLVGSEGPCQEALPASGKLLLSCASIQASRSGGKQQATSKVALWVTGSVLAEIVATFYYRLFLFSC